MINKHSGFLVIFRVMDINVNWFVTFIPHFLELRVFICFMQRKMLDGLDIEFFRIGSYHDVSDTKFIHPKKHGLVQPFIYPRHQIGIRKI